MNDGTTASPAAGSTSADGSGHATGRAVPKPGPHLAGALRRPAGAVGATGAAGGLAGAGRRTVRLVARVHGSVQGVGFRWWTRSRALELGLVGAATNRPDGTVEVVAEGPRHACERLLELLSEQPPRNPPPRAPRSWYRRPGVVVDVLPRWEEPGGGLTGFREG